MTNLKLEQIAYAQGWVEGRLEELTTEIEALSTVKDDAVRDAGIAAIRAKLAEVIKTYKIVSDGLDKIRRENKAHEQTILMVRGAVQL